MKNQISNEQCAMSNCCARQRNSKFLLLIASCALPIPLAPEAQAAKMCMSNPATGSYLGGAPNGGVAATAPTGPFALGEGCAGPITDGRDVSQYCASRVASGVFACINPADVLGADKWDQGYAFFSTNVSAERANATGFQCWCRITWPAAMQWRLMGAFKSSGGQCMRWCPSYCATQGLALLI
ncbi:MAG: hypothetical protein LBL46_00030 [Rickettsiales bacterium]|nr:hypothetical protein [Rickettsiales bacterium]